MRELSLGEIKTLELNILINFDKFCRRNNLSYFLAYGTLLGAVRHGGFIPWDDDIDVQMPRADYQKFLTMKTVFEGEFENIVVKTLGDKGYPFPFTKIENSRTAVYEQNMSRKIKTGVWIDIFPIDDFCVLDKKVINLYKKEKFYLRVIQKSLAIPGKIGANFMRRSLNYILIPIAQIYVKFFNLSKKIDKMGIKSSGINSAFTGTIVWADIGIENVFKKSDIYPLSTVSFCGNKFFAPKNPDIYLSQMYGNYMKLPPVEKRTSHLADAWEL